MPRRKQKSEEKRRPAVRPFWSGTISFGLVSVPVSLYPANRTERVSLRMLSEKGNPLRREYYDPETGKVVANVDLIRGFEVEPEEYVIVTDDELDAAEPRKSREIDLRRFVPLDEIPPIYFDKAYFLTPAGDTTKAYRLLASVMEDTGRAGIATFVMRGKEYLVAILAEDGILRAETLRFADEIRTPEDIGLPDLEDVAAKDVKRLTTAIRELEVDEVDENELKYSYLERLRKLVEKKSKSKKAVVESEVADQEPEEDEETEVIDLIETIRQSLRGKSTG